MEVLRLHVKNYRVTAFSEQKVFPFNHFRFDSILSFREDTADENLTVVISCVGREANAMQIGIYAQQRNTTRILKRIFLKWTNFPSDS